MAAHPFALAGMLYAYAPDCDYGLLQEHGIESPAAEEMLLDAIELALIQEDWLDTPFPLIPGVKQFNAHLPMNERRLDGSAPKKASTKFCPDHNPRRSIEARQRYQTDHARKEQLDETIEALTRYAHNQGFGLHTISDRTIIRKAAYKIVSLSTAEIVAVYRLAGITNLAEIGRRLSLSRQAISLALTRERQGKTGQK